MKIDARCPALVALLMALAVTASAQTADEIVEKHLAAIGGRAALAKLTSRLITGTANLTTPVGELSGPIEILNEAPNKTRLKLTLDLTTLGAGPMTFEQRFNGTSGYVLDSLQGNREITGDQLEAMKSAIFPTPFLNYKQLGAMVEVSGKEKVGDRDAYVLLVKATSGPAQRVYIDAESYLQVRTVAKGNAPPVGEIEQTTDLLDYRTVDGVKVPFQVNVSSTVQTIKITIAKVEHNIQIDETLFSRPAAEPGK